MRWGRWLGVALAVSFALAPAARAQEPVPPFLLFADAKDTGFIRLYLVGPPGTNVRIGERVAGRFRPLNRAVLDARGLATLPRGALWRCDRRTRRLVATHPLADGSLATATFSIRTPSCRKRLALALPRRAAPGRRLRIRVRDRWRIGDVRARVCSGPRGARCRRVAVPAGKRQARVAVRPARGRLRVVVSTRWQRLARTVYVGVAPPKRRVRSHLPGIVATGDSMMQIVASYLGDRLRRRAEVHTDVHPGTGPSKTGFDWVAQARRQTTRVHQRATLVFLGANDGPAMTTPAGDRVRCCEEGWVGEYARRAGRMMRAWTRRGGRVVWMTLPAPRNAELASIFLKVNEGVLRAAAATPRVEVLRLDEVFTPGFRYRSTARIGGRRIRPLDRDGAHLSVEGASVAAGLAIRAHGIP